MKYFGHIGPENDNLRVECQFINEGTEYDWAKQRDRYRKYDHPPFLKPETTQKEFYSEGLKGQAIAIISVRKLWDLVHR